MGFFFSNRLYLELLRMRIFIHIGYLRSTFSFDLFQSCLNCQKSGLISPAYFFSWFYPIELRWIEKDQLIIFFSWSALELIGGFQSNTDWFDMFVDTGSWSWIICIPRCIEIWTIKCIADRFSTFTHKLCLRLKISVVPFYCERNYTEEQIFDKRQISHDPK